jgi:hypothetical protein
MFVGYRAGAACSAYPTVVVEAPVFTERTSVGLDVHARSVAAAAIDSVTGELFRYIERRKRSTIANVAVARELAGWCWSLAVLEE